MLNPGYKPIDQLLEEANFRPPMARPADPLDTSPDPTPQINPPPAPQMQQPPGIANPDLLRRMGQNYVEDYDQASQDAKDNRVTAEDFKRQADNARLDALLGGLSNATAQIGNYRGQAATTTLPNTLKQMSDAEARYLQLRQQASKDARSQMDSSMKGVLNLDETLYGQDKRPFEMKGLEDAQTQRGLQIDQLKRQAAEQGQEDDANSTVSATARALASQLGLRVSPEMTASVLYKNFPMLKQISDERAKKAELAQKQQEALMMFGLRQQDKKDQQAERERQELDKRIEKQLMQLGQMGGQNAWLADTFSNIDKNLGFKLSEYNSDSGTVGGKGVDAPGVNIPAVGRTTMFSFGDDDRRSKELLGDIGKIFNTELRNRSGQAVTDNELKRLQTEFNSGKFNTEEQLLGALKRWRIAAVRALKAEEAGFNPKAIEEYKTRPGSFTSESLGDVGSGPAPQPLPDGSKIETINGKQYKVYADGTADPL